MAEQLAGELDFPNEKFVEEDRHLHEELKECRTPVLEQLKAVWTRTSSLLAGSTRATTLKRYLTIFKRWRLWLWDAKLRRPPGRP